MTIDLREHLEALLSQADLRYQQRFDAQTAAINAALQAAKEAVNKAEIANDKRFESVNEFRKTLSDQTGTQLPRSEANARFDAITEKIDQITTRIDKSEGAGWGLKQGWAWLVGAIGLGVAVASVIAMLRGE